MAAARAADQTRCQGWTFTDDWPDRVRVSNVELVLEVRGSASSSMSFSGLHRTNLCDDERRSNWLARWEMQLNVGWYP
jgi:hypothetical protein